MAVTIKIICLYFFFLLIGFSGWSQTYTDNPKNIPGKNSETQSERIQPATQITGTEKGKIFQDVMFATNEDCRLFIDGEGKGNLFKSNFLYVKLPAGTYHFIAKSKTTGDEWRDSFSVVTGKPNEVFVDMLLAAEAGERLRAESKKSETLMAGSNIKSNTGSDNQSYEKTKEVVQATIHTLIAGMVPVKGGTFVMGNNHSPAADEAEHPVMLRPFFMSKYEITQQQWIGIMGYNPSSNKNCPNCPVENVSWEEVMIFIRKINSMGKRQFRLPTEAEWEYVARMGGKSEIDMAGGIEAYIRKTAWAYVNSNNKTHHVGKKQPNVAGIFDLFGNVSEWCMDWYGAFYFKEDFTENNPEGPPLGKDKIIRGGNYKDYIGDRFRPSFRNKMNPKTKTSEIGFRLVMEGE